MAFPSINSRDPVYGLHRTPVILTSQVTQETLEKLFENQLPLSPCLVNPDQGSETKAPCPSSIRKIWDTPESALVRHNSCHDLQISFMVNQENEEPIVVWTGEHAFVWYDRVHAETITSSPVQGAEEDREEEETLMLSHKEQESKLLRPCPATYHNTILSPRRVAATGREVDVGTPSVGVSSRAMPRREASGNPSIPSTLSSPTTLNASRARERTGMVRMLGQALVSARARAPDEDWLGGTEEMREQRVDLGAFNSILSP